MNKAKIFQKSPRFLKYIFAYINGMQLNYWRKFHRSQFLRMLLDRETWAADKNETWQSQELKKMLDYARVRVPYYRKYWDLNPTEDHKNLNNWPILEKQTIRDNPELFISDDYSKSKLYEMHTSGTSGKPMTFWLTREALGIYYAMYELRIRNWNGVTESDAYGAFGGQLIVDANSKEPPFWIWNQPMNQLYFSSYHINENTVKHYVKAMFDHDLKYLLGYVSSIYNIAKIAKQKGIKTPSLKLVITNAEPLLKHQREIIEEIFDCKVIQTYSGCEYAFGGSEDLSGNMYLWPEVGVMEVLNESNKITKLGKGEFIITGLLNKAMPLIRYKVGDSGTIEPANNSNSRSFRYLSEITGRTDDLVRASDGTFVGRLDPVFKAEFNISEAQIIQETLTDFSVNIVPLEAYTSSEGDEIIERLKERVGNDCIVQVNILESIPKGANGKFKAVISHLKE